MSAARAAPARHRDPSPMHALATTSSNDTDAAYELGAEFSGPRSRSSSTQPVRLSPRRRRSRRPMPWRSNPIPEARSAATGRAQPAARPGDRELVADLFARVVIAPAIDKSAREVLAARRICVVLVTG